MTMSEMRWTRVGVLSYGAGLVGVLAAAVFLGVLSGSASARAKQESAQRSIGGREGSSEAAPDPTAQSQDASQPKVSARKREVDLRTPQRRRAASAAGQVTQRTILATPSGGGQTTAQIGRIDPVPVNVQLLSEPPELTPELREMIERARRHERLPRPPLPITGSPETAVPLDPPTQPAGARDSRVAAVTPGTFQFFVNAPVKPAGASTSVVAEPSVANNGKIVFQSGNWYAAISHDNGSTWQHVDPVASFPSVNGGFCCDQIVIYDPGRDAMFWLLQYSRDATENTHRFAVATGVSSLENLNWCLYDFKPSNLGIDPGHWFDFPDLVLGNNVIYWTADVFTTDTFCDGGQNDWGSCSSTADCIGFPCRLRYVTSTIARLPLEQMSQCGSFSFGFWDQLNLNPADRRSSWRACHGTGSTLYWAAHNTTSSIRIYRWEESSGSISWNDVTHDAFSSDLGNMTCPGPDGNDSCARADTRILGAYNTGTELGFMWISAAHGDFPYPYTRIARFQESDRVLIADEYIWNPLGAWTYPSVAVNSRGHPAGTIFFAGETTHPQCDAWIADDFSPSFPSFMPLEVHLVAQSDNGPAIDKWGDYLTARPHAPFDKTWIASGFSLRGGSTDSFVEPRHVWFGRERDAPPPAPINDECSSASVIFATPYASDINTLAATRAKEDPFPSCTSNANSNTVWYTFTPPCDGTVTIDTCNSNYNTVLTVYSGECANLTEIACDDDSCGDALQSLIAGIPVTADETLYIEVADFNLPGGGDLRLRFDFTPGAVPANDDCASASFIGSASSTVGTTRCADMDDDAPGCTIGVSSPGVWYRVRGTGRTMTATVCDALTEATFDSKISVYCDNCGNLTDQHCVTDNDDDCVEHSGLLSTVTWCSQYDATYLILVHGFSGSSGDFVLNVSHDDVPCAGTVDCGGVPLGACCIHGAGECSAGICGEFVGCGVGCVCGLSSEGDGICVGGVQVCETMTRCPNGVSECDPGEVCWVGSCCDGPVCSLPCNGGGFRADETEAVDPALTPMGVTRTVADRAGLAVQCLEMPRDTCGYAGGIYEGDGVACELFSCFAACCVDGVCIGELVEYDCEQAGGTWFYGYDCATVFCPPVTGACCPGVACRSTFECAQPAPTLHGCGGILGCVCFDNTEGGVSCLDGRQGCGRPCPGGSAECSPSEVCIQGSCCNGGVPTCAIDECPLTTSAASKVEPGALGIVGDFTTRLHQTAGGGQDGCLEIEENLCLAYGAEYQGDFTMCVANTCPAPGACCLDRENCTLALADECLALGGDPRPPGTACGPGVCEPSGACCMGDQCVGNSNELNCILEGGRWYIGEDCAEFRCPVETEACCGPEVRECRDELPDECVRVGGTSQGPGTRCLGDNDDNGIDDACQTDAPCEDCGPGPHWIDRCAAGMDHMPSGALVGIDRDGDCIADLSLRLNGPVHVRRSDPRDDSVVFPGLAPTDGHLEVIDTEITSLSMTGDGVTMTAGGGLGRIPLRHSFGAIVEQPALPAFADSFFEMFVEVDLGGDVRVYNQDPLRVVSKIDCVPPNTTYIHLTECVKLFTSPIPGEGEVLAYLTAADHSTYPGCGDPVTGSCFEPHELPYCEDDACCERVCEIEPRCCTESWKSVCTEIATEVCQTQACCDPMAGRCRDVTPELCEIEIDGIPQGFGTKCEGDQDQNGEDDACQADPPCEDCGPGAHWIDECRPGTDQMDTGALIGIDTNRDCIEDTTVRLTGPVNVARSAPRDDSIFFPGLAPIDGHLEVLDTEILSLHLSGGGMTMVAGGGMGQGGVLRRSTGAIVEQAGAAAMGDSFFEVFFEFDLGGGTYVYNHAPLRVAAKIDCVPPVTTYIHPFDCIPLYSSPYPGGGEMVAQLVRADHSTRLECGDPGTGDCFEPNGTPVCSDGPCCEWVCEHQPYCCEVEWDGRCAEIAREGCPTRQACCFGDGRCADLTPDECRNAEGVPRGPKTACQDDCNQNGVDDACEVLGDLDGDEDVDLGDWKLFVDCLTGPDVPTGGDCLRADLNCDGRVDLRDVQVFQILLAR